MKREYTASCRKISSLSEEERAQMASLYLSYYDHADDSIFFRDLHEKNEADILLYRDELVGFSTLLFYEREWTGERIHVVYSGDTIVRDDHWGQQALPAAWLKRIGAIYAREPDIPIYWFLLVKGHRTYRFLPSLTYEYHPDVNADRPNLKALADHLAREKFGEDYNPESGVIEFKSSHGNLKPSIAHPTERERSNPSVRFFLEKNPGYLRGHELVCLCRIAPDNLKPFARRIFESVKP